MKISFFDDEPEIFPLQYGGKARTIINLATEFAKHPEVDQVKVLSRSIFSDKDEFEKDGVKFVSLNDTNTISMIAKECDECDILNIHCCSFTFPVINKRAKKFYFLHDVLIATADKGSHLDKSLGGDFDFVIAPSEFAKQIYDKNKSIIGGKIECVVIPRNINRELFNKVEKKEMINKNDLPEILKKIIGKYKNIYFFPSRPIEEKGGAYMISLAKKLIEKQEDTCIIGPFDNIKDLPENCINSGWISSKELKYYYSLSDITFNFSTLPESFSQICIESIGCQTPVVSFSSGNIPYLSEMFDSLILCEKNVDSILYAVEKALLIKNDKEKMQEEQNKIFSYFDKEKIINKYIELYKKTLGVK